MTPKPCNAAHPGGKFADWKALAPPVGPVSVNSERRFVEASPSIAASTSFAHPDVVLEGWYVLGHSSDVKSGQVISTDRLGRRLALFRSRDGKLHVTTGRCPHLGADLGQGKVDGERLVCSFHGWRFEPSGQCVSAPGQAEVPSRRVASYAVVERWGLIFAYIGGEPPYDLPQGPKDGGRYLLIRPPSQTLRCHPHLVLANPLDVTHFQVLHRMQHVTPPILSSPSPHSVRLTARLAPIGVRMQPRSPEASSVSVEFTVIGPSLLWVTVVQPARFHILFTGLPLADGRCRTQTVAFLPRSPIAALRGLMATAGFLLNDRRMLEALQFRPDFVESDEGLSRYAAMVNGLPVAFRHR